MARESRKKVFCRNDKHGTMDFYLNIGKECFYLFSTRYYSAEIFREYQNGRPMNEIMDQSSVFKHRNTIYRKRKDNLSAKRCEERRQKLRERIVRMVKYIERENTLYCEIIAA